jgi:hypothetical protein
MVILKTALIKLFMSYCFLLNIKLVYPFSKVLLEGFVVFCFYGWLLKPSTTRQYISAHTLLTFNSAETIICLWLKHMLTGFNNMYKSLELVGNTRRAFTFPLVKLLGDTISDLKLSALESQTIWTAATTAFWCSCRMGDILTNSS